MQQERRHNEVRRAELLSRLTALEVLIAEQAGRTELANRLGWDVHPFEQRLKLLKESRTLYVATLKNLLMDFASEDGAT